MNWERFKTADEGDGYGQYTCYRSGDYVIEPDCAAGSTRVVGRVVLFKGQMLRSNDMPGERYGQPGANWICTYPTLVKAKNAAEVHSAALTAGTISAKR